jgi:hypothetical protein
LVRERRFGPAYWLACYQETKHGNAPLLPLLIKTLELADIVEGEGGPAARWLTKIYGHSDFEDLLVAPPGKADHPARRLFAFAALLRPAILAPDSGAPRLLGRLTNLPSGLSALCAAVAGGAEHSSWKEEARVLAEEVKGWQQRNQKLTTAAAPAAKLWESVQEEGGLVHTGCCAPC